MIAAFSQLRVSNAKKYVEIEVNAEIIGEINIHVSLIIEVEKSYLKS